MIQIFETEFDCLRDIVNRIESMILEIESNSVNLENFEYVSIPYAQYASLREALYRFKESKIQK